MYILARIGNCLLLHILTMYGLMQVHKKLGNTHLALMNFSWAMDLDPKGVNNQIKEAIDKRYATEEDDTLARLTEASELPFFTQLSELL